VFPKIMQQAVQYLNIDQIIRVSGRLTDKDGEVKIIAEEIQDLPNDDLYTMALSEMEKNKQIIIHVPNINNQETLNRIKDIITINPGFAQVYLSVGQGGASKVIKTQSQVRISPKLLEDLRSIPEVSMISDTVEA
jgi:hypothetical protein